MDEQLLEQIKALFQQSYSVVYKDGKFDAMADQAEKDGNVVNAVSLLVSKVIASVIKDAGVTDINVLAGLGTILIADLLDGLQQVGIEAQPGDMENIMGKVIQSVLTENPAIAEEIKQNPEVQQMMQQAQAEGGQAPQGQPAPQVAQPPQGVL